MSEIQHASQSDTGLASNLAGALTYVLGPLTGVIFLLIEKQDRFVRFHAAQSVVIGLAMIVLSIGLSIVGAVLAVIPILGWIIGLGLSLAFAVGTFVLWVMLMIRAFNGREWEVPVAGGYARRFLTAPAVP